MAALAVPAGSCGWVTAFSGSPNVVKIGDWHGMPYTGSVPDQVDRWGHKNAYFSVAALKADVNGELRRRKANFSRLLALVADDVRPEELQGTPSWTFETSPGKYQTGLLLAAEDDRCADVALVSAVINEMAARGMVTVDKSGNNPVRYVRLPAAQNQKDPLNPWNVRVLHWRPQAAYDLADAAAIFGVDVDALLVQGGGAAVSAPTEAAASQASKLEAATQAILRGEILHDSVNIVAASMVASGAADGAVVNMLRAMMQASAAVRDARWQARFDDIPRAVSTARERFSPAPRVEVDISAITQRAALAQQARELSDAIPAHLLQLPGVLGDAQNWMLSTAQRPQPVLAMMGALALCATALSQKVCSTTGLRTNLYLVSVAGTAAGKDHARKCVARALTEAGLAHLIGGDGLASSQGLLTRASLCPRTLFQLDEFGLMLQAIRGRNAGPHLEGIVRNLLMLFSATDSVLRGTEYADQKARPRQDIEFPCVNLHATTTPEQLWPALGSADVTNGGLNRMLVAFAPEALVPRESNELGQTPASIVEWVTAVQRLQNGMAGLTPGNPIQVMQSAEVDKMFADFGRFADARVSDQNEPETAPLWGRAWEHAVKLAMLHACAGYPADIIEEVASTGQLLIKPENAVWGIELATALVSRMAREVLGRVGDSEHAVLRKEAFRIISRASVKGCTLRELAKNSRKWSSTDPRTQDAVLGSLEREGQIERVEMPPASGRGKPRMAWLAAEFAEELRISADATGGAPHAN